MTNESAAEAAPDVIEHETTTGRAHLGMVVLYVRDLQRSIDFYRLLGLDVSDPDPRRPVAAAKEGDATRMIIATDPVARHLDAGWARPERGGYQQVVEYFVESDAAVDAVWGRLTAAGHRGVTAPGHLVGPYSTMVEDPDGNVVMVTNPPAE
ncbi:MAG: VOC family protein [Promicromonosporaceae bacterium]|nr:VOC family protein [Promicromonosporaceae bacterium]